MTKYLETKTNSIEEAIKSVVLGEAMSGKDVAKRMMKIQTMKSFASKVAKMKTVSRDDLEKMLPDYIDGRDITKVIKEKLDPVNKVAVKKKFDNRKDKDIDNDGDVDSTDKYLHKRRKAISKAIKSERVTDVGVDQAKRDLKHAKIQKKISDVKKEETELDEAKFQVNYSKGGKLFSKTINAKDEDDAEEKAIKQFKIDDDDIRSVVKESLDEGYESEVMKVLNKADIDGYFKMGKLYVNKRDGKDAKKALEDSDEITKLPKMVMEEVDPADVDITATDKDVENASKNIIIQLRKVITLRGMKPVEFASGKEKVNPNIAQKALSIHQNLRRTDEKDAFQRKIARSYKDLLNAVKGRK